MERAPDGFLRRARPCPASPSRPQLTDATHGRCWSRLGGLVVAAFWPSPHRGGGTAVTATLWSLDRHCRRLPAPLSSLYPRHRWPALLGGSSLGSWWQRFGPLPTFSTTLRPLDGNCRHHPTAPSPLSTPPPPAATVGGPLAVAAGLTRVSPLVICLPARDGRLRLWLLTRGTCRDFAAPRRRQ